MDRFLVSLLALVTSVLPRVSGAQTFSSGDLIISTFEQYPVGSVPIPQELTLYDSNGVPLRVLSEMSCGGMLARSSSQELICSGSSLLVILDAAGSPLRLLLQGSGFEMLGEIAPSGSKLLVGETTAPVAARVAIIGASGEVIAAHAIPRASEIYGLGINSMDLLSDRCTLVYTLGSHYAVDFRRVARFDVCSGQPLPDLFRLPESVSYAGGIRVLPNGDMLIATGHDTRRFTPTGREKAIYYGGAATISLTPDGAGFWAAAGPQVQRFSLSSSFPISAPIISKYNTVGAITVVDEWRAAGKDIRRRGARR